MTQQIQLFTADNGQLTLTVRLEEETVWLSQAQMGELFDTTPENVLMHLKNIFKDGELTEEATAKKILVVRDEGLRKVQRSIKHYNLDAIISVGYRVSSRRATQFRQWATRTLKEHLVQGFTLNQRRLQERGASRAAHLLYFVIKNHPLADGNKRCGSFLFLWYLRLNQTLLARPVEQLINDNTLGALALLVAESLPDQKYLMVRLIEQFVLLRDTAQEGPK